MRPKKLVRIVVLSLLMVYLYSSPSLVGMAVLAVLAVYVPYLIIVGEKRSERPLGYVAEVCPKCHDARTVKVTRVGNSPTVVTRPVGQGELIGFTGRCESCATEFDVQQTDYLAFEAKASAFPPITKTNPRLDPDNTAAQAAYERRARIRAEFLAASQVMADRYSGTNGRQLGFSALAAMLAACAVPIWLGFSFPDTPLWVDAGVFGVGFVAALVFIFTEPRRYFRYDLQGQLARALAPLGPKPAEVAACVVSFKLYGDRIGKFLDTPKLLEELSAVQPDSQRPWPEPGIAPAAPQFEAPAVPAAPVDHDARGVCPNCDSVIPLASLKCPIPKCIALFGPDSAWKIKPV